MGRHRRNSLLPGRHTHLVEFVEAAEGVVAELGDLVVVQVEHAQVGEAAEDAARDVRQVVGVHREALQRRQPPEHAEPETSSDTWYVSEVAQ